MHKLLLFCSIFIGNYTCYANNSHTDLCPWKSFSDLLVKDKHKIIKKGDTLSLSELKQDLDCLSRIYKYQYIGSYYPHRINLAENVEKLKKKLPTNMKLYDFMSLIIQSHVPVYDNHFSLNAKTKHYSYYQGLPKYKIYYTASNKKHFIKNCLGFKAYPTLTKDKIVFIKLALENDFKNKTITCDTMDHKKISVKAQQITIKEPSAAQKLEFKTIDNDILYIRIPFMKFGQSDTEKNLLSILADDDFQKNIIIDLRNNSGGSSLFGKMMLSVLLRKNVSIHYPEELFIDGIYNIATRINMVKNIQADSKTSALLNNLFIHYNNQMQGKNASLSASENLTVHFLQENSRLNLPFPTKGIRDDEYHGNIILLVNRKCASACEDLVADMKQLNHVSLIGTHTGGFFNYNDVGFLVLPNSKIQVNTTTSTNIGKQAIKDGVGFAPDFYDIENTDLINKAIYILRNKD